MKISKTVLMNWMRCKRRAWLQSHRAEFGSGFSPEFLTFAGKRLNKVVRKMNGPGVDLSDELDFNVALQKTEYALRDVNVKTIFEAAFEWNDVRVRTDMLRRVGDSEQWDLVEVKSASSQREDHYVDVWVQKWVLEESGSLNLRRAFLANVAKDFVLKKKGNYDGLLTEVDVSSDKEVAIHEKVKNWVDEIQHSLKSSEAQDMPIVATGSQCEKPFPCEFKAFCFKTEVEVPLRILPNVGKRLEQEFGSLDLRDLSDALLEKPLYRRIQRCHVTDSPWRSPKIRTQLEELPWPRYAMDFETVQQIVPLVLGSSSREALPFQWAVFKWDRFDQKHSLDDAKSFLEFSIDDMHRRFLETLLEAVGDKGPIFVHSLSAEKSILKRAMKHDTCSDLKEDVEAVIGRLSDTLKICRDNFYSPKMMGSFSLKNVVKAIPNIEIDYNEKESIVRNGQDAQLAWFHITDPETSENGKEALRSELLRYCAKDTLALIELVKYLSLDDKSFFQSN